MHDYACGFCGRSRSEAEQLVAGPNVFICSTCISGAREALKASGGVTTDFLPWGPKDKRAILSADRGATTTACRFCTRSEGDTPLARSYIAAICEGCLTLAEQLAQEQAT